MLHYHVWFNLKPGITEQSGLEVVSRFLAHLSEAGEARGFQLMKNVGSPPRSKLPAYHALIEFSDAEALDRAMQQQARRGIRVGGHGQVVNVVCDFHVEIFTSVAVIGQPETDALQACEI